MPFEQYTLGPTNASTDVQDDRKYSLLKQTLPTNLDIKRIRLLLAKIPYTFANFETVSTITYSFPNAGGIFTNYTWKTSENTSAPWSNYTVPDINESLHTFMQTNKQYLIETATGLPYYFIDIGIIKQRKRVVITCKQFPTSLPAGYTLPSGATWTFPATAATSAVSLDAQMKTRLGFTYNLSSTTITTTYEGDAFEPLVDPVGSIAIRCNVAKSTDGKARGTIAVFPLDGVTHGGSYLYLPPAPFWINGKSSVGEIDVSIESAVNYGSLVQCFTADIQVIVEIEY